MCPGSSSCAELMAGVDVPPVALTVYFPVYFAVGTPAPCTYFASSTYLASSKRSLESPSLPSRESSQSSSLSSPPHAHASAPAQGGGTRGNGERCGRWVRQVAGGPGSVRTREARLCAVKASVNPPKIPGHAGSPVPQSGATGGEEFLVSVL